MQNADFQSEMSYLIRPGINWHIQEAETLVRRELINLLKGEPWQSTKNERA